MTVTSQQVPELPLLQAKGEVPEEKKQTDEQPSGLAQREKLEAAATAWLQERDPYAA